MPKITDIKTTKRFENWKMVYHKTNQNDFLASSIDAGRSRCHKLISPKKSSYL